MSRLKLTEKIISLIDDKIEEIEAYAIDTQENEERYIHDLNCLVVTKYGVVCCTKIGFSFL